MKQILTVNMGGTSAVVPETAFGAAALTVTLSHWEGKRLDMALEVSYDGGSTWHAGGGCAGAASSEEGIHFHINYGQTPTHIRGLFLSDAPVDSTIEFLVED